VAKWEEGLIRRKWNWLIKQGQRLQVWCKEKKAEVLKEEKAEVAKCPSK